MIPNDDRSQHVHPEWTIPSIEINRYVVGLCWISFLIMVCRANLFLSWVLTFHKPIPQRAAVPASVWQWKLFLSTTNCLCAHVSPSVLKGVWGAPQAPCAPCSSPCGHPPRRQSTRSYCTFGAQILTQLEPRKKETYLARARLQHGELSISPK